MINCSFKSFQMHDATPRSLLKAECNILFIIVEDMEERRCIKCYTVVKSRVAHIKQVKNSACKELYYTKYKTDTTKELIICFKEEEQKKRRNNKEYRKQMNNKRNAENKRRRMKPAISVTKCLDSVQKIVSVHCIDIENPDAIEEIFIEENEVKESNTEILKEQKKIETMEELRKEKREFKKKYMNEVEEVSKLKEIITAERIESKRKIDEEKFGKEKLRYLLRDIAIDHDKKVEQNRKLVDILKKKRITISD